MENGEEGQKLVGALTEFITASVRNFPAKTEVHLRKKGIELRYLKYEMKA